MIEIEKNKNGKCLVISVFTLPDDDELSYIDTPDCRSCVFKDYR